MSTHILLVALNLFWAGSISQAAPQGEDEVRPPAQDQSGQQDANSDEARRAARRQRWQRYREASPEQRQKMRSQRMVDMATRTYELDESQKELVSNEIEQIQLERRAAMGAEAEQYDKLREEMFRFWQQRREKAGDQGGGRRFWRQVRSDPKFQKLRSKMREIDRKYPFNWRESLQRVEALLPEEQAKKGHAKLEERFQRFDRFRQRRRQRDAERAQRDIDRTLRKAEATLKEAHSPEEQAAAQRLLADARQKLADRPLSEEARRKLRERIEVAERSEKQAPKPRPLSPWEKYARDFIRKHQLTAAQQTAAMSILKDVQMRGAQIKQIYAPRIAAAKQLQDPAARKQRLSELNKPTERLFKELKTRLDRLLTASQRKKVRA